MAKRRTLKHRKSLRRLCNRRSRSRRTNRRHRRSNGGGWSDLTKSSYSQNAVSPGYQIHFAYSGAGQDCTGNPHSIRPGHIFDYTPKGLPGFRGGKRKNRKSRGGMAMPPAATIGPVTNPNLPPVSGSLTPKPGDFPDTTGVGGTVAQPQVVMSMPGVPPPGMAQMPIVKLSNSADAANLAAPKQSGGRYGFFPDKGPLNPINGVGTSPAPFGRIPCETGTYNPLNPNPGDIQRLSTAPLTPPYVTRGGAAPTNVGSSGYSAANFPTVQVGQADSMRYYAPTAGYRNDFMTFRAPSPVPGLTIQDPYAAKAFNQACIKTGGSRRSHRKGGATMPVAFDAGKFTPVTMSEIWTRKDFDGSNQGLPVKFGGKRKTMRNRRVLKRKSRKN